MSKRPLFYSMKSTSWKCLP